MEDVFRKALEKETQGFRELCTKLQSLEGPIEPTRVKLIFDLVLNLSAKTGILEQFAYGKLNQGMEDPMFAGLPHEKRGLLVQQLEQMTQAKTEPVDGKRVRTTHYNLLANLYEDLGYGRAGLVVATDEQNRENPYLLELLLIDALFKAAKQKISVTLSLIQVIQYLEPMIMQTLTVLVKKFVKPGTQDFIFSDENLPQYIIEHQKKEYHNHPILLTYYENESIPGYCQMIAHVINDAFVRIDEIMFATKTETSSSPHLAAG